MHVHKAACHARRRRGVALAGAADARVVERELRQAHQASYLLGVVDAMRHGRRRLLLLLLLWRRLQLLQWLLLQQLRLLLVVRRSVSSSSAASGRQISVAVVTAHHLDDISTAARASAARARLRMR